MFRNADLLRLIEEHGVACTVTQYGTSTYDVTTGLPTRSSSSQTIKGYFYNYSLQELDNQSVVRGDRKLALSTLTTTGGTTTEPNVGDTVVGNGDTVQVVSVQKIMSASSVMCYICQVRE